MKPLACVLALTACGIGTTDLDEFQISHPYATTAALDRGVLVQAIAELEHQIGGGGEIQITGMFAHDQSVEIVAIDPKHPTHLDAYRYSDGHLDKPSPKGSIDRVAGTFAIGDVPTELFPYAVQALEQAKPRVEGGHIENISISASSISFDISGARDTANVALELPAKRPTATAR